MAKLGRPAAAATRATAPAHLSLNEGQGTAADDGSPFAAKFAQAARMVAASCLLVGIERPGNGAFGRSNRYWSSDECVAIGGKRAGRREAMRRGVVVELVGKGRHAPRRPRSTCSAGQAKFASETSVLRATTGAGYASSGYSAAIAAARAADTPSTAAIAALVVRGGHGVGTGTKVPPLTATPSRRRR